MDDNTIIDELENLTNSRPQQHRPLRFHLVVAAVIIAIAGGLSWYYLATPITTKVRKHHSIEPLIEVKQARSSSLPYSFKAMGVVEADTLIELKPQVTGSLLSLNPQFTPGGFLQKNEIIATIDPVDYQLTLEQIKAQVAQAQAELDLELGRQFVAQKELELLGEQVTTKERELMLRIPQMNAARAALQSAQAKEEIATNELAHTTIRAPFAAVTLQKNADRSSRVAPATTIGTLAGTEKFRLRITIPKRQLQWIQTGDTPSSIRIGEGVEQRSGTITHIAPELEENSRMAVIYAVVDDPLCRKPENKGKAPLLLNSMVEVEIVGAQLEDVFVLKRHHLAAESAVFILDKDLRPTLRRVEIIARNRQHLFIAGGIKEGEHLVVSGLASLKREQ